jgi:uncharacterized protein YoaH (UPF0181 family)
LSDEKPEVLLKSALEKILYFEARSSQLVNDADTSKSELERLKSDLGAASQREIELRRVIAELEVRATRAHAEREEMARVADALRRERAELVGKMLEASRIHGADRDIGDFDLSQFIAQLRAEVLVQRGDAKGAVLIGAPPASGDSIANVATELKAQGRLTVSHRDLESLTGAKEFPGRSEETLFGFSVRELSAPDASARVRAAERLLALRHPAATPALATALHAEHEPQVQVALLGALSALAKAEAVPVVAPLLTSSAPEVRIAALKALLTLDAPAAAPHLAAATKDPDKAVRRRASLLALGLSGAQALELGTQAIRDTDADVRALAALVLGASNAETARPLLTEAMRDPDLRVRRAASQSLSRLLGQDVTSLVALDDASRRREVRRLASVPVRPVSSISLAPQSSLSPAPAPTSSLSPAGERVGERVSKVVSAPVVAAAVVVPSVGPSSTSSDRPAVVVPTSNPPSVPSVAAAVAAGAAHTRVAVAVIEAPVAHNPALPASLMDQLRATIRGCTLQDLASGTGASMDDTMRACGALISDGQVVRRGHKYFVA